MKIKKILIVMVLLSSIFLCNITTYAAFNAGSASAEELNDLDWSTISSEDLITLYNRCHNGGNLQTGEYNKDFEFVTYSWYDKLMDEIETREKNGRIVRVQEISDGYYEYKVNKDMTEEDEEKAEETEDQTSKYDNYSGFLIKQYLEENDYIVPHGYEEVWERKLRQTIEQMENSTGERDEGVIDGYIECYEKAFGMKYERTEAGVSDTVYTSQPHKADTGNAGESLDDVMSDADDFIGLGNVQYEGDLAQFSNTIYNILLSVGIIVAVIVGAIIGVKLMASNIDTKVEAKKLLIPYGVGCVVVFGGFAIWKIVVTILQGM